MQVGNFVIEPGGRLFVIAGPCAIEGRDHSLAIAERLATIAARRGVALIFKGSFDKANRTSSTSRRGVGIDEGLAILSAVRAATGLAVLTDIHEPQQASAVGDAVDIIQIPAFLSRQTDLLLAAARTGRAVNVKKGQFMAPGDMLHAAEKIADALPPGVEPRERIMLTERGTTFGYHDLVVDMRAFDTLRQANVPVIFDASHAVQRPGAGAGQSGGARAFIPTLARAAAAAGIDGLFLETHPDPDAAWSDATTVWPLDRIEPLIDEVLAVHDLLRERHLQALVHG